MLKDGYLTGHICLLFSVLLFTRVCLRNEARVYRRGEPVNVRATIIRGILIERPIINFSIEVMSDINLSEFLLRLYA